MVETRHVTAKQGDVLLLVGTMKGAFLMRSNAARARWEVGGPYFAGHSVYALAFDQRAGRHRLWAGPGSEHFGTVLRSSDDFGRTWTNPESAPVRFPDDTGAAVKRIWQILPGRAEEPQTLYCGVEPAALFESRDAGETWSLVRGLHEHPHRAQWQPGGGGLGLHTIVLDPSNRNRMHVAISAGGLYRTDDGGRTWAAKNRGVRVTFGPDKFPEFGQCVHKVVRHPARPERMFLQNHWGLYRSDDAGDSWRDIAHGVPSDFGFAMAMHPHDPDTVYILPIESDEFRCTPEGKLRVYRTRDAGGSWEPLTRGLPQKDALECVLRDAMGTDPLNPAGVYFGTRSGQVWGSPDGGHAWSLVRGGLPPVLCVKACVVGDATKVRVPRPANAKRAAPKKRAVKKAAAKPGARAAGRARAGAAKRRTARSGKRAAKKK